VRPAGGRGDHGLECRDGQARDRRSGHLGRAQGLRAYLNTLAQNAILLTQSDVAQLMADAAPRWRLSVWNGTSYDTLDSTLVPTAGTMYDIAATHSGSHLDMYVNGAAQGTGIAASARVITTGNDVRIGGDAVNTGRGADGGFEYAYIYNRALSAGEVRALYADPYGMWQNASPVEPRYWVGVTLAPQFAVPTSDVSVGAWTTDTGATTNLYQAVDETTASDADYIQSETNPSSSAATLGLGSLGDPSSSVGHVLHYRISRT
jgi:hypothetical protein